VSGGDAITGEEEGDALTRITTVGTRGADMTTKSSVDGPEMEGAHLTPAFTTMTQLPSRQEMVIGPTDVETHTRATLPMTTENEVEQTGASCGSAANPPKSSFPIERVVEAGFVTEVRLQPGT
jgi:hypothetical protein